MISNFPHFLGVFMPKCSPIVHPNIVSKFDIMATTIKYEIRKERPRPDGSFPIRIRITHNRKNKYLPTPWTILPSQIDKEGCITDYRIDGYVYDMIRDIRTKIDELGSRANDMSVEDIIDYINTEEEKSVLLPLTLCNTPATTSRNSKTRDIAELRSIITVPSTHSSSSPNVRW